MELELRSLADAHQAAAREPVLIIDDDERFCRLLGKYLAPHGFEVAWTGEAVDALEQVRHGSFSGVILDVLLPRANGFQVLREIRAFSSVPILMITACTDVADRVMGLETGADDYIPKNSSYREVLARLRALIRRAQITPLESGEPADLVIGRLRVSLRARCAYLSGRAVALTNLEFKLLARLARSQGGVLTRDQLISEVSDEHVPLNGNAINVHISTLRKKLGEDAGSPLYIHTVRGVGYKLAPPAPA
jgi:DNA-binding response OmpR family regulator